MIALGVGAWLVFEAFRVKDQQRPPRTSIPFLIADAAASAPAPVEKATPGDEWLLFRGNPLQTGVVATALPDKLEILLDIPDERRHRRKHRCHQRHRLRRFAG